MWITLCAFDSRGRVIKLNLVYLVALLLHKHRIIKILETQKSVSRFSTRGKEDGGIIPPSHCTTTFSFLIGAIKILLLLPIVHLIL